MIDNLTAVTRYIFKILGWMGHGQSHVWDVGHLIFNFSQHIEVDDLATMFTLYDYSDIKYDFRYLVETNLINLLS